jgi:hypothetical protein
MAPMQRFNESDFESRIRVHVWKDVRHPNLPDRVDWPPLTYLIVFNKEMLFKP